MSKKVRFIIISLVFFSLFVGCKKEEEEKKLSVDLKITPYPSINDTNAGPTTIPYLVFNVKFNNEYFDQYTGKYYRLVVDRSFITDCQSNNISKGYSFSVSQDTLRIIPSNDLPSNSTFKINLTYHIEVKNEKTYYYEHYVYKDQFQVFQYESSFSIGDYQYFDPNFIVTTHPANGSELNYLMSPYITFNKRIDELYINNDIDRKFKVCIDSAGLYSSSLESVMSGLVYSSAKDTLKLIPSELLATGGEYKIKLKYHVEVKDKSSNTFEILKKDGVPYCGRFLSSFTTNSLAYVIDTSDIEYAYPYPYQYHFLKNETTRGVLKLKINTKSALFSKGSSFIVRFSSLTGQSWDCDATYNIQERKFIFHIPNINFENQKIYKIEYIVFNDKKGVGETFLSYHFRTSMFDTFEQKLASINSIEYARLSIGSGCWNGFVKIIIKHFNIQEGFDFAEGKAYSGLVRFEAYRDPSSPWVYEMFQFYDLFEKSSLDKNFRPRTPIHIPPTNAIALNSDYIVPLLSEAQINSGIAPDAGKTFQRLEFNLVRNYTWDYCLIMNAVYALKNPTLNDNQLKSASYTGVYTGSPYKFYIYYNAGDSITYKGDWVVYMP